MTHMLTSALLWLEKDFAVFPLMPRGKIPLGSLAPHGFKDATRDHAIIREWWRRSPEANIGIATGSGRFVLDLDDADAAAWFGNSCERHGGAPSLTVRTARGFHVFFASDAPVPNSAAVSSMASMCAAMADM
jgi:Bifunctional DNA primase/polymerase, N-terminal